MQPFLLGPSKRTESSSRMRPATLNPGNLSTDLSPTTQTYLNLPSPYHHSSSTSHQTPHISSSRNAFANFWQRLGYKGQKETDNEMRQTRETESDEIDEGEGYERKPRFKHVTWADNLPTEEKGDGLNRWISLLILLLSFSLLFNLFLLLKGPPLKKSQQSDDKKHPVPHDAFQVQEQDKNYTCYATHEHVFQRHYEYESLEKSYDSLWEGEEVLGKSKGYIHTAFNRPDGETRPARLAMFHQLSCLAKIRTAAQNNGVPHREDSHSRRYSRGSDSGKRKDAVWLPGQEEPEWTHCFDYLKQVLQCHADDTVEISYLRDGAWKSWGFGSRRQCRNRDWLYDVTKCGEGGCEGGPFS
ncbi:hypothetical protein P280DRAFT_100201 [Massarina eburnea CBS 473.64]|uniref:Uncharacterized protein n=1 Tax=Massarina eburnea CBS 473.64 TaxID=1395130 RepID=A0A6A6RPM9_9PLEO|nr:hypothetical protein P280DRAFT_100201 [Massarina eburnea CBS 473.64]